MTAYRRLPGVRRGLIHGASTWIAADHLLAVRSTRFREDYKRFYLRDIQAIVVADAPRLHVSTRAIVAGVVWLAAWLLLRNVSNWVSPVFWTVAIGLVGAWLYVSTACSCRCRIYTAVSRDEFPSVYRTWIARRFLREVERRIAETQGVLDGDWPAAVESRTIGPPGAVLAAPKAPPSAIQQHPKRPGTRVSGIFVGALLASSVVQAALLSTSSAALQWTGNVLDGIEVAAACAVFVAAYRGRIRPAMQKLALTALITLGVLYYARPLLVGYQAGAAGRRVSPWEPLRLPDSQLFRQIEAGSNVLLALAGLAILLIDRDQTELS